MSVVEMQIVLSFIKYSNLNSSNSNLTNLRPKLALPRCPVQVPNSSICPKHLISLKLPVKSLSTVSCHKSESVHMFFWQCGKHPRNSSTGFETGCKLVLFPQKYRSKIELKKSYLPLHASLGCYLISNFSQTFKPIYHRLITQNSKNWYVYTGRSGHTFCVAGKRSAQKTPGQQHGQQHPDQKVKLNY